MLFGGLKSLIETSRDLKEQMANRYRNLPSVDKILSHPQIAELLKTYKRRIVVDAVRAKLQSVRGELELGGETPTLEEIAQSVATEELPDWIEWPTPVINATGVILHTNLGRSPLSESAILAVQKVASGYTNLELELEDGKRGSRNREISELLTHLTGADESIIVNNNAGAVLLGLAAIGGNKEVIISRGEATEIGGGFRIPDVLDQSGARLVEVGTVNRTYASDYSKAITKNTAALLVVHRSNFQVVGFTHHPEFAELTQIARDNELLLLHDLGSGAFLDTSRFGFEREVTPSDSIKLGADLVFFSGDKLLGGPQAGIIIGNSETIQRVAIHPTARALRADKLTLAALHATLLHYMRDEAETKIPVWRMVSCSLESLKERAETWANGLTNNGDITVVAGKSTMGGGSLPGGTIDTFLLRLRVSKDWGGATELAAKLRHGNPSIIARIDDEHVLFDPRTVFPEQDGLFLTALLRALR